ncbi:hypothetical protein Hdeb2414_s0002g00053971 [Helianthus debilis subsp. tardiflorus]
MIVKLSKLNFILVLILGMSYGIPDEDQARKENRTHVSKLPQRSYFVLVQKWIL